MCVEAAQLLSGLGTQDALTGGLESRLGMKFGLDSTNSFKKVVLT